MSVITTTTAPLAPFFGTQLQRVHAAEIARAAKVEARERVVSEFRLGDAIKKIEDRASEAFARGEIDAYSALYAVARELTALILIR